LAIFRIFQVCVGVALVVLISLNLVLTSYAWKRYSSVIANFFEEEKKEKFEKEDGSLIFISYRLIYV
uniref:Anoctamin n=1 Tax=Ascaris lumbricoides TaxID=6252 RepID=A0A0M3IWD2_ASCLU